MNDNKEEDEKLVDRFLTPKAIPDKDKQKKHFEKMLGAFKKAEVENSRGVVELSDDELDFLAAAGPEGPGCIKCPICGKMFSEDSLKEHVVFVHRKV